MIKKRVKNLEDDSALHQPSRNVTPTVKKSRLSPIAVFIFVAVAVTVGYFAGTNHNQIMGAIGPLFGYNAHDGEIDLSSVQDTYRNLAANYDGPIDKEALIRGASRGLVEAAGDPYTVFMDSSEASRFNDGLSGNIGGGIGAEIGLRDEQITIIRTLKSNPAEQAGLHANDKVLRVNDQSTEGWSVDKAVSVIRGEEGTTVKLTVLRDNEVLEFSITRAIINNPSVDSKIIDNIGVLTITRFDEGTAGLARSAARELKDNNVAGVVLDLRGNTGGYLSSARDVAGIWLDGQVVVTERSGNKTGSTLTAGNNPILNGIPTAVLINAGSASASEIVAGALQDHKVATLIGESSFGKGSVQRLVNLVDGSQLKVTIARWYTPSGKNISNGGITPDIMAELTQDDINAGIDPQMDKAIETLKR